MSMQELGKIVSIETVRDVVIGNATPTNGNNGSQMGISGMLNILSGGGDYDGYRVTTVKHTFMVLISNEQNCCEEWGYLSSNDDLDYYIGAVLREVKLTDTALNQKVLDKPALEYFDSGGVQFVDFATNKGTFQLAVYNGHNGYYGHSVFVTKDNTIIHSDTI